MSSPAVRSATANPLLHAGEPLRVAFVGARVWLDGCCPTAPTRALVPAGFELTGSADCERTRAALDAFRPAITVVFDPLSAPVEMLRALPGVTLGVLVERAPEEHAASPVDCLDRLVSFDPALTGTRVGAGEVWRAIPPPVGDAYYREVRRLHRPPRAMSIGRASEHREAMLVSAKHHHDLLQVIHGVSGEMLIGLLAEYQVGVYVAPEPSGGFGQQVGLHLAAGHLLISEELTPKRGLERNIDFLHFDSPDGLAWVLDRLGRFPEMHHRITVRGRLKAEQYRASHVFARLAHDLLADVAAFG